MKRLTSFIATLFLLLSQTVTGSTTWTLNGKDYLVDTLFHAYIGPGTTLTSLKLEGPVKFRIFYTTTDLTEKYVDVRGIKHTDRLVGVSTISEAMESHDTENRNYFAGVNADFFSQSSPCGITVIDREVYGSEQSSGWYLFGMNENKLPMIGSGELSVNVTLPSGESMNSRKFNRNGNIDELVVYSHRFGEKTTTDSQVAEVIIYPINTDNTLIPGTTVTMQVQGTTTTGGSTPIPEGGYILSGKGQAASFLKKLSANDEIKVKCAVRFDGITGGKVTQALGGCPPILSNGKVLDTDNVLDHLSTAQPRTAVGFNAELTKLVMLVADGRSSISVGPISKVLAGMMKCAGCTEALNFDGGGSSEMYVDKLGIVNVPSDGKERQVTNGLYLSTDAPQDSQIAQIRFKDYAKTMDVGESYTPEIYGYNQYGVLIDTNVDEIRLNTADGKTFTPEAPGCYALTASYNGLSTSIAVTVGKSGGINRPKNQPTICYPNPVKKGNDIHFTAMSGNIVITIFGYDGKQYLSSEFQNTNGTININTKNLQAGPYIVSVKNDSVTRTFPIIIK